MQCNWCIKVKDDWNQDEATPQRCDYIAERGRERENDPREISHVYHLGITRYRSDGPSKRLSKCPPNDDSN